MTVLITGSAGRIGRAIYIHLANRGYPVRGVDRSPCSTAEVVGDLTDPRIRAKALDGVTALVHTAALHAPHVGLAPDSEFQRVNVALTQQLVEEGRDRGMTQLVFTSTTALYGHASAPSGNQASWIDESVPPRPKSIYHTTKLAAERWLKSYSDATGLPVTVLRMSRCFPEAVDRMSVFRLNRGIDARDVASGHERALQARLPGFHLFNLSGSTPFEPGDRAALLGQADALIQQRAPKLAAEFDRRGWELPASLDRVYDSSAAQRRLGWKPVHGFESVLAMHDQGVPEVLPAGWQSAR